jgi:hypothetical protein
MAGLEAEVATVRLLTTTPTRQQPELLHLQAAAALEAMGAFQMQTLAVLVAERLAQARPELQTLAAEALREASQTKAAEPL